MLSSKNDTRTGETEKLSKRSNLRNEVTEHVVRSSENEVQSIEIIESCSNEAMKQETDYLATMEQSNLETLTQISNLGKNKGRPKRKRGFKGNISSNTNISRNVQATALPVRLLNNVENICFLNSALQVLYHIPLFKEFLRNKAVGNDVTLAVKDIFHEITVASRPIKVSNYLHRLNIPNYIYGNQSDSHELLLYLLDEIYQDRNIDCIFKFDTNTFVKCENLPFAHRAERSEKNMALTLNVENSWYQQSVNFLIQNYMQRHHLPGYRCDSCSAKDNCFKSVSFSNTANIVIIQLSIFKINFDGLYRKLRPSIKIDKRIDIDNKHFNLQGIIYHHGVGIDSGHYTSGVNIDENWYTIDDSIVTKEIKFKSTFNDDVVPYILIYINNESFDFHRTVTGRVNDVTTPDMLLRNDALEEIKKQSKKATMLTPNNSKKDKMEVLRLKRKSKTPAKERMKIFRANFDDERKVEHKKMTKQENNYSVII